MRNVHLFRLKRSDQGTLGKLFTDGGFFCYSLELPWRDNKQNISCIPSGEYITQIRISPKFGKVYWLTDVPGRSWILTHSGNWAGDINKGYNSHVNGCILLGINYGTLIGQLAVLNSKLAVNNFMRHMNDETFKMNIYEAFKGGV